jgi:hypothetical protein
MLDSQKYTNAAGTHQNSASNFTQSRAQNSDASASSAFAPEAEFTSSPNATIMISGPAWAEYHLLLDDPNSPSETQPPSFMRIEREIRTLGGAPAIALLLARWRLELHGSSSAPIELSLLLGHDPNARLLRRELQLWAELLPNLRLRFEEEGALEVPYRILMWPHATSTCSWQEPSVLECGDISGSIYLRVGAQVLELPLRAAVGHEIALAAQVWAASHGYFEHKSAEVWANAALAAWRAQPLLERIGHELAWRQVQLQAEAAAEEEQEIS